MRRVAFAGPVASGKSTAAQRVHEQFGHRRVSIVAPVYQIAREMFGMTTKDRALLRTIGMTGRALDPDTWIRKCIESLEDGVSYVIDDVCFPNEVEALRRCGFVVIWLKTSQEERARRIRALYPEQVDMSETSLSPDDVDIMWSSHMLDHHIAVDAPRLQSV